MFCKFVVYFRGCFLGFLVIVDYKEWIVVVVVVGKGYVVIWFLFFLIIDFV